MINLNMSNDDKVSHLKSSPLFQSLLSGHEIRYSDVIAYYIRIFNRNPFKEDCPAFKEHILCKREYFNTDLWIDRPKSGRTKEYSLPLMLVENKLKSLPDKNQLKGYTEKFISEYIENYKEVIRMRETMQQIQWKRLLKDEATIINDINNFEFYLLTPMGGEDVYFGSDGIKKENNVDIITPDDETRINIKWEHISYSTLGKNMGKYLNSSTKIPNSNKIFWEDFSSILISYSMISAKLKRIDLDDQLQNIFTPSRFFSDLNLNDLHGKFFASRIAKKIADELNIHIGKPKNSEIKIGEIVAHHNYTTSGALFDIKKRISSEMVLILQYQAGEFRKGLVIQDNTANQYEQWFLTPWNGFEFHIMKAEGETDEERYNKFKDEGNTTFYYSKFSASNVPANILIQMMVEFINNPIL